MWLNLEYLRRINQILTVYADEHWIKFLLQGDQGIIVIICKIRLIQRLSQTPNEKLAKPNATPISTTQIICLLVSCSRNVGRFIAFKIVKLTRFN